MTYTYHLRIYHWPTQSPAPSLPGSSTSGSPQMLLRILKWYEFNCQRDFDVFNALDLMENKEFLEKLKFGIGDGNLQYYLYNWKCPFMAPEKVSY